jgi:hypothetical protein
MKSIFGHQPRRAPVAPTRVDLYHPMMSVRKLKEHGRPVQHDVVRAPFPFQKPTSCVSSLQPIQAADRNRRIGPGRMSQIRGSDSKSPGESLPSPMAEFSSVSVCWKRVGGVFSPICSRESRRLWSGTAAAGVHGLWDQGPPHDNLQGSCHGSSGRVWCPPIVMENGNSTRVIGRLAQPRKYSRL